MGLCLVGFIQLSNNSILYSTNFEPFDLQIRGERESFFLAWGGTLSSKFAVKQCSTTHCNSRSAYSTISRPFSVLSEVKHPANNEFNYVS